jgi:hypothetical protein
MGLPAVFARKSGNATRFLFDAGHDIVYITAIQSACHATAQLIKKGNYPAALRSGLFVRDLTIGGELRRPSAYHGD